MSKNSVSDSVAQSMFEVLTSEEHAKLFKKAYVNKEAAGASAPAATAAKPVVPAAKPAAPAKADDGNDAGDSCHSCNKAKDKCMCKKCSHCSMAKDKCMCGDSAMAKESKAFDVAMENLLVASAALDYAGLSKGSELTLKLAALVAEAKKGKVSLKGKAKGKAKKSKDEEEEEDEEDSKSSKKSKK